MENKNTIRVWDHGTHQISKVGLWGSEESIRLSMLDKHGKNYLKFDKLNGLQKKVIRKLGLDKNNFIKSIQLTNKK